MKGSGYICFLFIVIALKNLNFISCTDTVVITSSGAINGSILETWTNKKIFSFRGIPFAEPPIGRLRFKPPVPITPWEGVINAVEDGKNCPQIGKMVGPKDENCLFLNVYSKNLKGNQPVIVFFHPGAFYSFSGASYWYGPDYLLDHDIVLVTVNYRLDALGFLSTGSRAAPGNNGLKDQVIALRWVKENIQKFGGNPDDVTISGYSAGSRSVLLHLFSPMTKGLFHRAIAMGAGFTSNFLVDKNPMGKAKKLAGLLNCETKSTENMIECLRNIPADDITSKFNQMRVFAGRPDIVFSAVIEPDEGVNEERFLTDHPVNLIQRKQFHQVPVVTGICEHEFVGWGVYVLNNETLTKQLNAEFDTILPALFGYKDRKNEDIQNATNLLRQFYFNNKPITKNDKKALGKMYSDYSIIYGVYSSAKLLAKYSEKPVYFYKLDYEGRYGWVNDPETNKTVGPSHHDDLMYIFYMSRRFPKFNQTDPEAFMVRIETSFWKNFATSGNPTPDGTSFQWTPLSGEVNKYLTINKVLKMDNFPPFSERMKLWESLFPIE